VALRYDIRHDVFCRLLATGAEEVLHRLVNSLWFGSSSYWSDAAISSSRYLLRCHVWCGEGKSSPEKEYVFEDLEGVLLEAPDDEKETVWVAS
jgi:hypothetical protein